MLVTWYDFLCHSDVTSLPPLFRYPLSIAWLRVRVARYTHLVYSPSDSCHSDVTSLPPLFRYPLSIAWLRVGVARYTFLFSLAWPWRMKSLFKHNILILGQTSRASSSHLHKAKCSHFYNLFMYNLRVFAVAKQPLHLSVHMEQLDSHQLDFHKI